jgi:uncharacterized protein (DUF4213/DUF364 family)
MTLLNHLLDTITDAPVIDVRIGLHWTAVVVEGDSGPRCGLASTLVDPDRPHGEPLIEDAGSLQKHSGRELAAWAASEKPTRATVGVAALNALIPPTPSAWTTAHAEEVILQHGTGKRVAIVGSFPFLPRIKDKVGELLVLEKQPRHAGEYPAEAAPDLIPTVDVVCITGMTLANHTLDGLLALCAPDAFVMVLGPSTPLHPLVFEYGVNLIAGTVVVDIDRTLAAISQGASFRQIKKTGGVRLVTMTNSA